MTEDLVLVGAPRARRAGIGARAGAAFLYDARVRGEEHNHTASYRQTSRLLPADPVQSASFGACVAMRVEPDGKVRMLIGSPGAGGATSRLGAIYSIGPFTTEDGVAAASAALADRNGVGTSWPPRLLGPGELRHGSRFGAALSYEVVTGMVLVGGPPQKPNAHP